MAIHGYKGGVISATPPTTSVSGASGIWTVDDALQAGANWPVAPALSTNSVRLRSSASAYLSRTPASAGNRKTWTWSAWVKVAQFPAQAVLFAANTSSPDTIEFGSGNLGVWLNGGSDGVVTSAVYRDPSAWYHIVVAVDTTQATASNRVKIYVNGSQVTALGTANYPSQNLNTNFNNTVEHNLCRKPSTSYFDGYLTEINFIDGQALTPNYFGATDAATGVWQPATYRGTYGTNGFYLPFTDNSALTTSSNAGLGKDFSGNGNYWTTNNISITSGSTYDSMTDVPTLTSATTANFATLNPLNTETGMTGTLSAGNLNVGGSGGKRSTISMTSGKWYWEFVSNSGASANFPMSGLYVVGAGTYWPGYDGNSFGYFQSGGIYYNGSTSLTVSSYTDGDIIGFAYDADTGKIYVAKNGTWQNSGNPVAGTGQVYTLPTGVERVIGAYSLSGTSSINFGQRPFSYTPPTGFVALNTYNLPTPTIGATASTQANKYMDATLYTGNGTSQSIVNAGGFQPSLVWNKDRSAVRSHRLTDAVRGTEKALYSNLTNAEATEVGGVTAFNSNGFSVGSDSNYNANTDSFVAWQWKANGTGVSNTAGSITSTVSANTSAGFSIVTYTTPSSFTNATVGHGLGVAPAMIITKARNTTYSWDVWHKSLGSTQYLLLNSTNAVATDSNAYNGTSSSTFTLGSNVFWGGYNYVSYCFAEIAGYSKFGSYTGNGSTDGPFVYCGFRPRFVMVKKSSDTQGWYMYDSTRGTYNVVGPFLEAQSTAVEGTATLIDFLSNGFKIRESGNGNNTSGGTYVYMAFAETPFNYANAR